MRPLAMILVTAFLLTFAGVYVLSLFVGIGRWELAFVAVLSLAVALLVARPWEARRRTGREHRAPERGRR